MWMLPIAVVSSLLFAAPSPNSGSPGELRVACIGDSITYGSRVVDRENNAYPAQLDRLLGAEWEVRNFGVGGKTLLRDGDTPFVSTDVYGEVLAWKPQVSVVILGTNDSCQGTRGNWDHEANLERDARELASALLGDDSSSRVILCTPPPMFPEATGLKDARRENLRERLPRLQRIGEALRVVASRMERVDFLDLSRVLEQGHVVDGVHTTPFGARAIARRVSEAVRQATTSSLSLEESLEVPPGDFHGFERFDFQIDDSAETSIACTLVAPHQPAAGYPWIWRARFFGHEPDLDRELLSRGFHLAYCDVSNLYGSGAAMERWDRFHRFCTQLGLAERVVLEGMSRGGLVVLNWASRHPELVEAIYLDNPVCDFRSWPGGQTGKRSETDWARCLAAYEVTEAEVDREGLQSVDRLEPLTRAGIPLFVVMGNEDHVVPPAENGERVIESYLEAGAPVQVWRKPGDGHHPHGLHPVQPLLRSLLTAAALSSNPAAIPMPSVEYRGHPAGWGGGTWRQELDKLRDLATRESEAALVFLGDSITQGLTGSTDRVARPDGARVFDRFQGARGALSLGLSGDRTEHLLYRIEHGALATLDPAVVVLMIGVNNVHSAGHTGAEVSEGLAAVVQSLLQHEPQAHVLVCGPFPTGPTPEDPRRIALDQANARAADLGELERVTYLDLRGLFLDEQGFPNTNMSGDHIHITGEGQTAWMEAIEPALKKLLGD